jgi:DNA (cytosine-5)-methyltransferase 1
VSNAYHFRVEPECDITRFAIGREWDRMGRPGTQSDKYFQLVRPDINAPCPTITATAGQTGAAGVTHPTERRKFSIAELKRLCGFPDDFNLCGTYTQQWERCGRAVPPVMMAHIAAAVRDGVLLKLDKGNT